MPEITADPAEKEQSLEQIITGIDRSRGGEYPVSLSQAWRYREEVRAKYGLPECGYRGQDPQQYIHAVEEILRRDGVRLHGKHEFTDYFRERPNIHSITKPANTFRDITVVADVAGPTNLSELWDRANQLAHEVVHACQLQRSPRMPTEEAEREAYYYQFLTPEAIRYYQDAPTYLFDLINGGIEKHVDDTVRSAQT